MEAREAGAGAARSVNLARWRSALGECPLVAILRGLREQEAREIGLALYEAGLRVLEVPLNGAGALLAIRALSEALAGNRVIQPRISPMGLMKSCNPVFRDKQSRFKG